MVLNVIITVPHGICPVCIGNNHPCDEAAMDAARMLSDEIVRTGRTNIIILVPKSPRGVELDANRKSGRGIKMRKDLLRMLQSGEVDFVFDVHSFPQTRETKELASWYNYDLVIMKPYISCCDYRMSLSSLGKSIHVVPGNRVNDITNTASEHEVPSLLLEFNESAEKENVRASIQKVVRSVLKSFNKM